MLDMSWIRTERWPSVTNKGPIADKIKESPKEVEHNLISVKKKPKKIKTIVDKPAESNLNLKMYYEIPTSKNRSGQKPRTQAQTDLK